MTTADAKRNQIIDKNKDLVYTIEETAGLLKVNKNYVYALYGKGFEGMLKRYFG